MAEPWIPTVNDLRVKLCYICRDEERADDPDRSLRQWTHPCSCTLIAHESCLLQWIHTSQQDASRAANALKCPQCGASYELESENPFLLRLLEAGNKSLFMLGKMVTFAMVPTVVVIFGTGIYIISTAYGAYALQQFLGKEAYDLFLTDDPSNWPWHAFFNLPLIPFSLILSRTPLTSNMLPIIPVLLSWPTSRPVDSRDHIVLHPWDLLSNSNTGTAATTSSPSSPSTHNRSLLGLTWPPAPALIGFFVFPVVRALYRKYMTQFSHWVLNTTPVQPLRDEQWRVAGGLPRVRLRFGVGPDPPQPQPQAQGEGGGNANANLNNPGEHTIHLSGSSLGRLIGGALIVPEISNIMGSMLFRLSAHSSFLRRFLAIRPRMLKGPPPREWWMNFPPIGSGTGTGMWSIVGRLGLSLKLIFGLLWGGSQTWVECDPVWWRNSIGLGIFIVAKDCIQLLHLWLAKRELESRRVKNKSFEGVDIRELDLITPLPGAF